MVGTSNFARLCEVVNVLKFVRCYDRGLRPPFESLRVHRPAAVRAAGPPQCGRRASGGRVVDDVKEFVTNLAYTTAQSDSILNRNDEILFALMS